VDLAAKLQCEHWEKMMRVAAKRAGNWDSNNRRLLLSISVRDIPPEGKLFTSVLMKV
jgi:hypothetical protein